MRKLILISVLVIIVAITSYVYWYYYNAYSDGYKEGVLQKIERRGNLFKTYEGELLQVGFAGNLSVSNQAVFYFSVDDETIADTLQQSLGKTIRLHYIQYRRSLPWRGDNYDIKHNNNGKGQEIADEVKVLR